MNLKIVAIPLLFVFIYSLANVRLMVFSFNEETFSVGDEPISVKVITEKNKEHLGTVLFIHGYSGHKETLKLLAYAAASTGLVSVLVDLPGHGGSGGFMEARTVNLRISQFEDSILEVVEFLRDKGCNLSKLSVVGHSMGGALACYLGIKYDIFDVVVGIAPGIGYFVDIESENFSLYRPKNLLIVLAENDIVISEKTVIDAFKETINQGLEFEKLYNVDGHYREIIKIPKTSHTSIIYNHKTHNVVVSWIHKILFGSNITLQFDTQALDSFSKLAVISGLLALILLIISVYGGYDEDRINISGKIFLFVIGLSFIMAMVAIFILLLTRIILSALTTGCVLGFVLSFIIVKRISIKSIIIAFKPKNIALGLALGFVPIAISEMTMGIARFSFMPGFIRRIYAFPIFLVVAIFIFWFYFRVSILNKSSNNIIYEILDIIVLLLPPIALIILFTSMIAPRGLVVILSISSVHIAIILALSLFGRYLGRMDLDMRIIFCATIYAILAINLSPITKLII